MSQSYMQFSFDLPMVDKESASIADIVITAVLELTSSLPSDSDDTHTFKSIKDGLITDLHASKCTRKQFESLSVENDHKLLSLYNDDDFINQCLEWALSDDCPFSGMDVEKDDTENSFSIYTEEGGCDLEEIGTLLQYLIKLNLTKEKHILIEFCWYCTQPISDSFGGSAVLITADFVKFMPPAQEWAMHELKGY